MNKVIGIIVLILGVFLTIFFTKNFKTEQKKHENYLETVAVVTGYEECKLDDDIGYRYIATYKIDRDSYQIVSMTCSNVPKKLGKEVKIKYNPNNPSDAVFTNDISRFILPFVGGIFALCGIVLIRKDEKKL